MPRLLRVKRTALMMSTRWRTRLSRSLIWSRSRCASSVPCSTGEQAFVGAGEPREHFGVLAVALADVLIDRPHLAGVRHQHPVAQSRKKSADPRTLHPDLHDHQRAGVPAAQRREATAGIGDRFLLDDPALAVQHAHGMLAVAQVNSYGDVGFRFSWQR